MRFEVTILGNGSASPAPGRHQTAHALNVREQFYLIDCGEGTRQQLLRAGISPLKLRAVFISHIHGDHLFGLIPLIASLGLAGKQTPLKIFGPAAVGRLLDFHQREFGQPVAFELDFTAVDTTRHLKIFENRTVEVWSVPLRHRTPTAGYLFIEKSGSGSAARNTDGVSSHAEERLNDRDAVTVLSSDGCGFRADRGFSREDGTHRTASPENRGGAEGAPISRQNRSYAYLSDTLPSPRAAGLVRGADLLYHEATFAHTERTMARNTGHSTAAEAARIAVKAGVDELLLGHFSSRYKDVSVLENEARAVFPRARATREGETYSVAPKERACIKPADHADER